MKIKRWLKGALSTLAAVSVMTGSVVAAPQAHAATRVDVTNQGAQATGPAVLPTTDMQAAQQGFSILDKSTAQNRFPALYAAKKGEISVGPIYRVSVDGGSAMLPFYYRATEIVPIGDTPKASGVTRYVMDDGTFETPGTTDAVGTNAMTTGATVGNTINYDFGSDATVNSQYLGAEKNTTGAPTGYAGISVAFYRPTSTGAGYLVCVTPTSFNPDTTWGDLVPMPARFTPQAGYNDRPELGYLVGQIYQTAGLQANNASITNPAQVIAALQAAWTAVASGVGNATLDSRLTNADIQAYATKTAEIGAITGPAPVFSDPSYFLTAMTQIVVQYYLQGVPLNTVLDDFRLNAIVSGQSITKSGASLNADNAALRNFARLLISYIETAREKDSLSEGLPGDITATIAKSTTSGGTTTTTFNLGNVSGATELLVRIPSGVTLVSPSSSTASKAADQSSGFVAIPAGTTSVTVSYPSTSNISSDTFYFKKYGTGRVSGKLYSPSLSYQYDSTSGHWIALELVSKQTNSNKVTKWAAQSMLMISGDDKPTSSLATAQIVAPTLSTVVSVNGTSSTSEKAVEVTAADAAKGLKVSDTVTYTNLSTDKDYMITATIMDATNSSSVTSASGVVASNASGSITNVVTHDFKPTDAAGSTTVDFGTVTKLDPSHTYVIYTTLTEKGKTDVLASGTDAADLAESFIIGEVKSGTLSTTVGITGDDTRKASDSKELTVTRQEARTGVQVSDTITYQNLVADTTYAVTGTLRNVTDNKDVKSVTVNQQSGTGSGTWTIDFGVVSGLEVGKKYVVYETAVSTTDVTYATEDGSSTTGKQVIKHEDDEDKAQTVVVDSTAPAAELRTSVSVKDGATTVATASPDAASNGTGITARPAIISADSADALTRTVVDKVWYRGLIGNQEYTITGQLMDVTTGTPTAVAEAKTTLTPSTESMDDGAIVTLTFENVTITPGHTYVVYETATSNGTVTYTDDSGTQQTGTHTVEHKNPSDQAQTVVVYNVNPNPSLGTTVEAGGTKSAADAPVVVYSASGDGNAAVAVKDTVDYTGLTPGVEYTVTGTIMQIDSNGGAKSTGITASTTFTPAAANGSVVVDFGTVTLQAGVKYVVFESAESTTKIVNNGESTQKVVHEDPSDTAQTAVVLNPSAGEILTKVSVNYTKSDTSEGTWIGTDRADGTVLDVPRVATAYVKDSITYSNLAPGQSYEFTATLMKKGDSASEDTVVATKTERVAVTDFNGTAEVEFTDPVTLEPGVTYYVKEKAVHVASPQDSTTTTYTHEDREDKNQTFKVSEQGTLKTTVSVDGTSASENAPVSALKWTSPSANVTDTVDYFSLRVNSDYTMTGTLMKVTTDDTGAISTEEVATASKDFNTGATGTGTVVIDFGEKTLEPGAKYVVFETATQKVASNPDVIEHKDPNDTAQTLVVTGVAPADASLRTTVTVDGGYTGSDTSPAVVTAAGPRNVKDTIDYTGLAAGAEYTVTGTLMKVEGSAVTPVQRDGEDLTVTTTQTVSESGSGKWTIDFGTVELELGAKYVVYERAESVKEIAEGADGTPEKQVLTHEDPNALAQTIVVPVSGGEIGTTVSYTKTDGTVVSASAEQPLQVSPAEALATYEDEDNYTSRPIDVVDTITYKGLLPNATYTFEGLLQQVENGQVVDTIASGSNTVVTDASGEGTATVTFHNVELKPGVSYVAFETASSANYVAHADGTTGPHVVTHENPNDVAQTVTVPRLPSGPGSIRTVASVDGSVASAEAPAYITPNGATATSRLVDTIIYQNLVAGATYKVTGTLMKVEGDVTGPESGLTVTEAIDASGNTITATDEFTPESASGLFTLDFGVVDGFEAGARYVVYEHVISKERIRPGTAEATTSAAPTTTTDAETPETSSPETSSPAVPGIYDEHEHKDPKDNSQTILIQKPATIRTQVQMGSATATTASPDAPAAALTVNPLSNQAYVKVTDNVFYTGLIAGKTYVLTGELMQVNSDGSTELIARQTVDNFVPEASEGTTKIVFERVGLQANHKYVVFETLTSVDALVPNGGTLVQQKLEHKDVNDKAQTIVINEYVPGVPTTPVTPTTQPWEDPWPYSDEITPPSSTTAEPSSPTTVTEADNPLKPWWPVLAIIPFLPIIPVLVWPYNSQITPPPAEPVTPGTEGGNVPAPAADVTPVASPEAPVEQQNGRGHLAVTGASVGGLLAIAVALMSIGFFAALKRKRD
ncbi:MAG: VaFE repeat-containing surface-anchored protein [Corynebacterium sp.]|nr:VaFE repeat-containing surface-anchored protein [Corynebacterium sp.]